MISDLNQWRAQMERRLIDMEADLASLRSRSPASGPVIHVRMLGNIANRMIQYMAALALQSRLPGARVAGISLPEWGLVIPAGDIAEPALRIPDNRLDLDAIPALIAEHGFKDVLLLEYLQNVRNLLPAAVYRPVFTSRDAPDHHFESDEIVISLRMNEVLTGFYPFYTLLPIAFYQDVVRATGLRPVFFGQLTPSPYLDSLREAFPGARFIAGREPMADFAVLRSAPNLCLSISTFAWTAAFLSQATRIVIPVTGLFSRQACACFGTDHDLMPRHDPRYDYWLFPADFAVPGAQVLAHHEGLAGRWRRVDAVEAAAAMDGDDLPARRIEDYLALFSEPYYLAQNREVATAVADGRFGEGSHHYERHGFLENRRCFALEVPWYAARYPDAADAVGFGLFRDLHHFHAARGAALGYEAVPAAEGQRAAA